MHIGLEVKLKNINNTTFVSERVYSTGYRFQYTQIYPITNLH